MLTEAQRSTPTPSPEDRNRRKNEFAEVINSLLEKPEEWSLEKSNGNSFVFHQKDEDRTAIKLKKPLLNIAKIIKPEIYNDKDLSGGSLYVQEKDVPEDARKVNLVEFEHEGKIIAFKAFSVGFQGKNGNRIPAYDPSRFMVEIKPIPSK